MDDTGVQMNTSISSVVRSQAPCMLGRGYLHLAGTAVCGAGALFCSLRRQNKYCNNCNSNLSIWYSMTDLNAFFRSLGAKDPAKVGLCTLRSSDERPHTHPPPLKRGRMARWGARGGAPGQCQPHRHPLIASLLVHYHIRPQPRRYNAWYIIGQEVWRRGWQCYIRPNTAI